MLSARKPDTQLLDCVLEYSQNISEDFNNRELFNSLHLLLAENDRFAIEDIQSRAVIHKRYYVGDGGDENAFMQLTVTTLLPLDQRLKTELGDKLIALLEAEFNYSFGQLNYIITVKINEVATTDYCKSINKRVW